MNETLEALRERLASAGPDDVYSALIAIGKAGARALQAEVIPYLVDDDPQLRSAAIRVLGFYWESPAWPEAASWMVDEETEPGPRSVAVMAWAAYGRGSRSPAALRRLYALLADDHNHPMVRRAALGGIMVVAGVPGTQRALGIDTGSTEKIDWVWVRRVLEACGVEVDLPPVSPGWRARLGIRKVIYDWNPGGPTRSCGPLLLTFNNETELVDLREQWGPHRKGWRAHLPAATWNHLIDTLNRYQFPRPVTDAAPRLPGSSSTRISWERDGELQDVGIGGRTADYSDVNRIAFSVIAQMAPELVNGDHSFPNTEIEASRELPPAAL